MYGGTYTSEYFFGHCPGEAAATDDGFVEQLSYPAVPAFPPSPLPIPDGFGGSELDSVVCRELGVVSRTGSTTGSGSCTSGYSSYGSPNRNTTQPQRTTTVIHRSVSSHSLHKNSHLHHQLYSPIDHHLLDSELGGPVRRVFSTGDLQGNNLLQHSPRVGSPLSNETGTSITTIEGLSRACRYSPEEKKERIERYRSKRNQRNFNKKIQYACRKTLADSRPRIRGRFAKNEETDHRKCSGTMQGTHAISGEEDDVVEDHWFKNILYHHEQFPPNHLFP